MWRYLKALEGCSYHDVEAARRDVIWTDENLELLYRFRRAKRARGEEVLCDPAAPCCESLLVADELCL